MEQTKLFVAEPFVEGNKNLANTVILYEDWIFYIDENLDVYCRPTPNDSFYIEENDTHNHWYDGNDETDLAIVLESDVESEHADEVADKFMKYAYKDKDEE
ncbi:hypothetical protein SKERS_69 [Escherichia phage vB_EcoM_Skers]|nr:hypothetical protein SKERS_69 [Escherichia phage vB_EcoM_Skers]